VSEGRRREFPSWNPIAVPDPQAVATHARSIIDLSLGERGRHADVRRWYRALIALRRQRLTTIDKSQVVTVVDEETGGLAFVHGSGLAVAVSLRGNPTTLTLPSGHWRALYDAADFGGPTGARLDGERVHLPAWGGLVIESAA
jgi:hypothetical protein